MNEHVRKVLWTALLLALDDRTPGSVVLVVRRARHEVRQVAGVVQVGEASHGGELRVQVLISAPLRVVLLTAPVVGDALAGLVVEEATVGAIEVGLELVVRHASPAKGTRLLHRLYLTCFQARCTYRVRAIQILVEIHWQRHYLGVECRPSRGFCQDKMTLI